MSTQFNEQWGKMTTQFLRRYRNPRTERNYRNALRDFNDYRIQDDSHINPIAGDYRELRTVIEAWAFARTSINKASTVVKKVAQLTTFYNWLLKEDYREWSDRNPASAIDVWDDRPDGGVKFPTTALADQFESRLEADMLENCVGRSNVKYRRNLLIFRFLREGGFRVSELRRLQVEDVELETGRVRIKQGKGGKSRITAIQKETAALVERMAKDFDLNCKDFLFMQFLHYYWPPATRQKQNSKPITCRMVEYMLSRYAAGYGFSPEEVKLLRRPHGLRHLWALEHIRLQTNVVVLLRMAGWKKYSMLDYYIGEAGVGAQAANKAAYAADGVSVSAW